MDSGWAVVLGAVIALAGSSVIPWIRESIAAVRLRAADARTRRNTALIALLTANAACANANAFQDKHRVLDAMEARSRAVTALLLEVPSAERSEPRDPAGLCNAGGEDRQRFSPRAGVLALQLTLTAWADGTDPATSLTDRYTANLATATQVARLRPE